MKLLENAAQIENEAGKARGYQVSIAKVGHIYPHREIISLKLITIAVPFQIAREIKGSVFIQKRCNKMRPAYAPLWLSVDGLNVKTA